MQIKSLIYRLAFYTLVVSAISLSACSSNKKEQQKQKPGKELQAPQVPREKIVEWQKDKLSLFVHFGAYSLFEGEWNNKIIDGPAENIWASAGIPPEVYERKVREFNPKKWDATDVVNFARDIGMKRIILNAKHHDGFCLFETVTTQFDVLDFTPFNRDLVNEMADACKKGKINFSLSFSLCNWHLPEAGPMSVNHNSPVTDDHHQINITQIEELLTQYGAVSEIYFYSGLTTPKQSREIRDLVKRLQPDCLISNGIGNDMGDFIATEFNTFPKIIPDVPWNMPASAFDETKGFKKSAQQPDPTLKARQKIREMIRTISSGGNYSLNIGPRSDGSLSGDEEEIIKNIGRWIKVNREAIYNVEANPFNTVSSTYKITRKADKLYLFIESVPGSSIIRLTGLENKITSARFLGSGIEPGFSNKGAVNEIIWTAPAMADPMELPVIEVEFEDPIKMLPLKNININPDDTLTLNKNNAIAQHSITQQDRLTAITSTTSIKWNINADHKQKADLIFTQAQKGRDLIIETAGGNNRLNLEGKQSHLICSKYDTIQINDIYQSETYFGDFTDVHINPNGSNRLRILDTSWRNQKTDKATHLNPLPMSAVYYYLETESENDQQYSFKITGNDGLQIWLNQQEILLTRNTVPGSPLVKEVVFDLKKGKNILIIKNYNRVGEKDYFDLSPLPEAHWWKQTISIPANPGYINIKPADPANPHADIDLRNFFILLTPES